MSGFRTIMQQLMWPSDKLENSLAARGLAVGKGFFQARVYGVILWLRSLPTYVCFED